MKTDPWFLFLTVSEREDLIGYEATIESYRDRAGQFARKRKLLIDKATQRMKRAAK